jgi:hypothetical protein
MSCGNQGPAQMLADKSRSAKYETVQTVTPSPADDL